LFSIAIPLQAADENAPKAAADPGPKLVKIVHVASGKVLGTEEDAEDAGTSAKIVKDAEKDKENPARQWKVAKAGSFYKIANAKSNQVLDVSNESTDEDGSIIIWDDKPDAD